MNHSFERVLPKFGGFFEGIKLMVGPPGPFISGLVEFHVMGGAEGDCEFITDFSSQGPGLGKADMMCLGGSAIADQARVARHKFQVFFVAQAFGLGQRDAI